MESLLLITFIFSQVALKDYPRLLTVFLHQPMYIENVSLTTVSSNIIILLPLWPLFWSKTHCYRDW